jgi:AcrR family transcriptional regulator
MAPQAGTETTQAERSARSTKALLDAAAGLIVEGGFSSLTYAAIGERAGYSRGLVTARFGSKDGLVEALINRIVGTWNHRNVIPYTKGKNGLAGVTTMLDAIRRQAALDPRGLRVLYALMFEALGPDELLRARIAKFHREMRCDFARFVERGVRDGSVRPGLSPRAEAALVIAGLRGIGYQWLLDPDGFDPVSSLEYLHDTTSARLAAPSTSASPP